MTAQREFQKIVLTRQDLAAMNIEYSNGHLLKLEEMGLFPRRIYLSKQKVCWDYQEVMSWFNEQKNNRSTGGADV